MRHIDFPRILQRLMLAVVLTNFIFACSDDTPTPVATKIKPVVVTEPVQDDSDDPAIWLHPTDPGKSLVLGTDKAGILFVFNLDGEILKSISDEGMARLNNVDVEYGMLLGGKQVDIAMVTDRDGGRLHAFTVPDFNRIDNGGFEAFAGTGQQRPMGMALYKRQRDGAIFAIVSRKEGPSGAYLWQYQLHDDGSGSLRLEKVREFGEFSGVDEAGEGEIEAVAVDDELGYVYYSDELYGIHKYHADPEAPEANRELALFGTDGFKSDREGISIYKVDSATGYILVSDQDASQFRVFTREGSPDNPHDHQLVKVIDVSTIDSDGCEATSVSLGDKFQHGLFVAMSDDKTFQFYSWADLAGDELRLAERRLGSY